MNMARRLTQNLNKLKIEDSKYKIGDLVLVHGSWEGKILDVQKGRLKSSGFGHKRVETNKFFYKIKYRKEWNNTIKMVICLIESNCFTRRESIWK